ncbi:MAG: ATP-grasp domain-containing protein [Candidatus Omnitrophica bacterium]|nr:ATP-grasp domain-containing protein [Candidatus Omnitrophota bacterium]
MKIGITYNLKDEMFPVAVSDEEYVEEFDTPQTIDAISTVFEKQGFETLRLGGDISIVDRLKKEKPDFVFNIAEGYKGRNREAHIPSILEMLHIPYSGSDPLTLALTLDKTMTKKLTLQAGIPTPRYVKVEKIDDLLDIENRLSYPMITKPAWEGSSKGIYKTSKVYDKSALEKNVIFLFEKYPNQPVMVEEYIRGREISVAVMDNDPPSIFGIMEIVAKDNSTRDFFYSLEVKRNWENEAEYILPPKINIPLEKRLRHYATLAFKEFGCRDIAGMNFRISQNNEIYFLEINPLPGLSPEYSDLVIMATKLGIKYEELILSILHSAFLRNGFIKQTEKLTKVV